MDHVGTHALRDQPGGEFAAEEFFDRVDAVLLARYTGDVAGRLDAKNLDAAGAVVLEQITVIAGDFDNKRVLAQDAS